MTDLMLIVVLAGARAEFGDIPAIGVLAPDPK
jgi:hypothetical protein